MAEQQPHQRAVGSWILEGELGRGSFAVVWRARHAETGALAAVKEINTERLNKKLQESLASEVAVLSETKHRNVVGLLDLLKVCRLSGGATYAPYVEQRALVACARTLCGKSSGAPRAPLHALAAARMCPLTSSHPPRHHPTHPLTQPKQDGARLYIVLEYCAGGDLGRYIRRYGRVSEAAARYFLLQLAEGLKELRRRDVVHRDLKPQNLLLSDAGAAPLVKIADVSAGGRFAGWGWGGGAARRIVGAAAGGQRAFLSCRSCQSSTRNSPSSPNLLIIHRVVV